MSILEIFILAVALSIDACVVSFSQGLIFTHNRVKNSFLLALAVGFFQFFMPVLGGVGVSFVQKIIEPFAPYIVFTIFLILGLKFIKDALDGEEEQKSVKCDLGVKYIIAVAVATSIDALAAGVNIRLSSPDLIFPSVIIGIVTFINSLLGFWSGQFFKHFPSKNLEISGGVILILLAIKAIY
ncbi:manganese efflux pump [bacterium]|nr:manganese efflux pump [bacterium]